MATTLSNPGKYVTSKQVKEAMALACSTKYNSRDLEAPWYSAVGTFLNDYLAHFGCVAICPQLSLQVPPEITINKDIKDLLLKVGLEPKDVAEYAGVDVSVEDYEDLCKRGQENLEGIRDSTANPTPPNVNPTHTYNLRKKAQRNRKNSSTIMDILKEAFLLQNILLSGIPKTSSIKYVVPDFVVRLYGSALVDTRSTEKYDDLHHRLSGHHEIFFNEERILVEVKPCPGIAGLGRKNRHTDDPDHLAFKRVTYRSIHEAVVDLITYTSIHFANYPNSTSILLLAIAGPYWSWAHINGQDVGYLQPPNREFTSVKKMIRLSQKDMDHWCDQFGTAIYLMGSPPSDNMLTDIRRMYLDPLIADVPTIPEEIKTRVVNEEREISMWNSDDHTQHILTSPRSGGRGPEESKYTDIGVEEASCSDSGSEETDDSNDTDYQN